MKPKNFDITLYTAGIHETINSLAGPLVALSDQEALDAIVGYIVVHAAQPSNYDIVVGPAAVEHFILHAQYSGLLDVEFLPESFEPSVRRAVPTSPPVAPTTLSVSSTGAGAIEATTDIGGYADSYDLQMRISGVWTNIASGVIGETDVTYTAAGLTPGSYNFRVVPRIGFFSGFPTDNVSFTVV